MRADRTNTFVILAFVSIRTAKTRIRVRITVRRSFIIGTIFIR